MECPEDCLLKTESGAIPSVLGSGNYGLDSPICVAAVHAGAFGLSGVGLLPDWLMNDIYSEEMRVAVKLATAAAAAALFLL